MKVNFEFLLPEDQDDLNIHLKSKDLYCVVWDLDQYMRNIVKYGEGPWTDEQIDAVQKVRDHLWALLRDRDVEQLF